MFYTRFFATAIFVVAGFNIGLSETLEDGSSNSRSQLDRIEEKLDKLIDMLERTSPEARVPKGAIIEVNRQLIGRWVQMEKKGLEVTVDDVGTVSTSNFGITGRVRAGVFDGANFAFEGLRDGKLYSCAYSIQFLNPAKSQWNLISSTSPSFCPVGIFEKAM